MHNLQIQVRELCRLKIEGGGTPFPRVPPYFDHCREARLVEFCLSLAFLVWQWSTSPTIEKDLKPAASSYGMDEAESQKDAALWLIYSDGGPLRRVRDPGGLESEGLTLRSGSILKSRSPHMSQISDWQASTESSAVTAQGQAVLSQSESESAIAHAVSTATADFSQAYWHHEFDLSESYGGPWEPSLYL